MTKYCPTCGNQLQYENAEICPKCGVRIHNSPTLRNSSNTGGFAGFWVRLAAYIVDSLIVSLVTYGSLFLLFFILFAAGYGNSSNHVSSYSPDYYATLGVFFLLWCVFAIVFVIGYFAIQESSPKQATIGKQLMGLIVTDYNGHSISLGTAIGRYLAKILSAITLCIGFLMIGFTEKKQGLHDLIVKTYVIKKSEPNSVLVLLIIGIFVVIMFIIVAAVVAAFVFGMAGNISKTKVVSMTAYQQGNEIIFTYQGGQDSSSVTDIVCDMGYSETVWKSPKIGEQMRIKGATSGNDHIVCSANFTDGMKQVILDTSI